MNETTLKEINKILDNPNKIKEIILEVYENMLNSMDLDIISKKLIDNSLKAYINNPNNDIHIQNGFIILLKILNKHNLIK